MSRPERSEGTKSPSDDAIMTATATDSVAEDNNLNENTIQFYGDLLEPKEKKIFRGISVQLNGLPVDPLDPKHEALVEAIIKHDPDVVAFQEVNINFSRVGVEGQWKKRLGWNTWLDGHRCKTVNTWNQRDTLKQVQQHGGTAILARGDTSFFAAGSGVDSSKLGRWCWTRYRGRDNTFLRIVSFYRPCLGGTGEMTVTAVQRRCLQDKDDHRDPRQAFLEDLKRDIDSWTAAGDALVLCGDINQDILSPQIVNFFESAGLRHLIFSKHDSSLAPPTYYRATRTAVDGIWASPSLDLVRGGYLPKLAFPGDHLPIWFELSYHQAFGHSLPKIWKPQARRLQLRDPRCVKRYNRFLRKFLLEKQLPQRQFALESDLHHHATTTGVYSLDADQQTEAWNIDVETTKCMLKAEKRCRKLHMGGVLFSEETMLPRYAIAFWQLAIKRRKGEAISTRQWSRFKQKANISTTTVTMSIEDMQAALAAASTAYKDARKLHETNRLKFIESFAPKDRDRILRTEEARRKGRISKLISGKGQGQGVINIQRSDMVDGQEVLTDCHTPNVMNTTLLEVNSAKYQQCDRSPFLNEPLFSDFGYLGDTPHADMVLNGTYIPPPLTDPYATLLLAHMKRPPNMPSVAPCSQFVTTENHSSSWKKAKEYTSSGISGLHFGMFKAQARDDDLAKFDASRRSIMYCTGGVYPRWNKGVDCMLLKASGDTRAHKLRTILLLEADYNMNCKLLGREAMWTAEKYGCIAREQAGGRRAHCPEESSLNMVLVNDDSRFKRKAMAICSNDAKGCFDRIVHSVAVICLRRFGLPQAPLTSMFQVIQQLDHHIRTAFGDSEQTYGPNSYAGAHPNQGTLQGNGASGAAWTAVSSAIVEAMRSQGFGYKSWSAISKSVIQLVCSAFVDDTDLVHSGATNQVSGTVVAEEMQQVLDTWDGLLRASGGALEKQKSFWYLIDYERRDGAWHYKSMGSQPCELMLFNDETQQREPIKRLSHQEANKALGLFGRPDGVMKQEVNYLRSRSKAWADSLRTKRIRKDDAWYCVNTSILRTIEYPLTATSLTAKQCAYIMSPILKAMLPTIHVQRNMPRVLLYSPHRYQGRGINDPWAIQLIKHLLCILRHCGRPTLTGDFINATMEDLALELGSATPFWDLDYPRWQPVATSSWVTFTWEHLDKTDLQLKGPLSTLKPLREHDLLLMDKFITLNLPPESLVTLNEVRMYKQVMCLSDITSADGQTIQDSFLTSSPPRHPTPYNWPRCYRPNQNQMQLWKSTILECFIPPHANHRRLAQPLGAWTADRDTAWEWWHSASEDCCFQRTNHTWIQWNRAPVIYHRPHFRVSSTIVIDLPPDARRATTSGSNIRRTLWNTGTALPVHPDPPQPLSLETMVQQLDESEKWAIDFLETPEGTLIMAEIIRAGKCVGVTDASYKNGCGTAAFILVGLDDDHGAIRAVNQVPGPITDGNSYRCEITGIYGILLLIRLICLLHDITEGSVHLRCDNLATIRLFDPWFIPNPSQDSFDLVNAIWHMIRASPLTWTAEWVEGHQDDTGQPLDRFASLNCEMDRLAKKHRGNVEHAAYIAPQISIAHEGWSIWCNGEKLHSPHRTILYDRIYAPKIKKYWTSSHELQPTPRIPPAAFHHVDWNSTEALMRILPLGKQIWCMKHGSENCGVGITLQFWKKQADNGCPCCGAPEDTTHVLRCTAHEASTTWAASIATLTEYLDLNDAPPEMSEAILSRLAQWRSNIPFTDKPTWSLTLCLALHQQDEIGWKNFMEGLPAKLWSPYVFSHFTVMQYKRCPRRWFTRLLMAVLNVAWSQWEYRNHFLHQDGRPRFQRAVAILKHHITREFLRGIQDLPPSDHHHFSTSLLHILTRTTAYQKHWYTNVIAARQSQDRRVVAAGGNRPESMPNARLAHWIRTGRLQ
jgi:exonuclease III